MNKTQLIVLWVGIAVIVFVGFNSPLNSRFRGHFRFEGAELIAIQVHYIGRLCMRWTMTAIVTTGLIYTLRDQKKSDKVWQWITKFWQSNEQKDKNLKGEQN